MVKTRKRFRPFIQLTTFAKRYRAATGDNFQQAFRDSAQGARIEMEVYAEKLADQHNGNNLIKAKITNLPEIIESVSIRSPIVIMLHNTRVRLRFAADFEDLEDPLTSLTLLHTELKGGAGKRCIAKCHDIILDNESVSRQTLQMATVSLLIRSLFKDIYDSITFAAATTPPPAINK